MIQTRFDKQNTACDDCILWAACLAPWLICCCECAGCDVPDSIENCVDCMQLVVSGCMLAQQQVEIRHVQKTGFMGAAPGIVAALPPSQQHMISQAKPMGPMATAGVAAGGLVGGAAGAAAMYSTGRADVIPPAPQAFGYPVRGIETAHFGSVVDQGGFMISMAPNGMSWSHYCAGQQIVIDSSTGYLAGSWGECLAWAKVFEIRNPGWADDPCYKTEGPCGQVIQSALQSCPHHLIASTENAANRLETACEAAASNGFPLPLIGQIA